MPPERDLAARGRGAGRGRLPLRPRPADRGALRRGEAAAGARRRAGPPARPAAARRAHRAARPGRRRAGARGRRPGGRRPRRPRCSSSTTTPAPWLPLVDRVVEVRRPAGSWSTARTGGPCPRAAGLQPAGRAGRTGPARRPTAPASPTAAAPTRRCRPPTSPCRAGRALAVTGPNGTGKSTLALLLAGLRAPTTGRVEAAPSSPRASGRGGRAPHRWRAGELVSRIGTVFQHPEQQFLTGRLRDELALGPLRSGRARRRRPGPRPRSCSSGWAWPPSPRRTRTRSPAGSSAGCRSRPRWPPRRGCWCSTSRRSARTRPPGASWWRCWPSSAPRGCAVAVVTHDADLVDVLADDAAGRLER